VAKAVCGIEIRADDPAVTKEDIDTLKNDWLTDNVNSGLLHIQDKANSP
jgi:hypothetical protein